jgi:hypothetical protein
MKVYNPHELVGKEVCDANGNPIGWIDKTWNSWDQNWPGYIFGIKPNPNAKTYHFRGTQKLIPIYNDFIREVGDRVTLNRTLNELSCLWNKTVPCGQTNCPTDKIVDMPVFDKHNSRVGTLYAWLDTNCNYQTYGCFVDPYLCQKWNLPTNTLMPIPTQYLTQVTDTVTLDKSLDELRQYWQQHRQY